MSNRTRLIIGMIGAALVAAFAVPELAAHLPPGVGPAIAFGITAALHRMNAEKPADEERHEDGPR